jgi:hypothetical protein
VGSPSAISKGVSAGGAGGGVGVVLLTLFFCDVVDAETCGAGEGVGVVPLTLLSCDVTDVGTSTIFVAVTTIPFLRPNASTISPFTLNF